MPIAVLADMADPVPTRTDQAAVCASDAADLTREFRRREDGPRDAGSTGRRPRAGQDVGRPARVGVGVDSAGQLAASISYSSIRPQLWPSRENSLRHVAWVESSRIQVSRIRGSASLRDS
jgi:hypothetical protein